MLAILIALLLVFAPSFASGTSCAQPFYIQISASISITVLYEKSASNFSFAKVQFVL